MDVFISQIIYMPLTWQIEGFIPCRGQSMTIRDHQALFALIGTKFGGDGVNNFNIPDLRPWSDGGPDYGKRSRREWNEDEIVPHMALIGIFPSRA